MPSIRGVYRVVNCKPGPYYECLFIHLSYSYIVKNVKETERSDDWEHGASATDPLGVKMMEGEEARVERAETGGAFQIRFWRKERFGGLQRPLSGLRQWSHLFSAWGPGLISEFQPVSDRKRGRSWGRRWCRPWRVRGDVVSHPIDLPSIIVRFDRFTTNKLLAVMATIERLVRLDLVGQASMDADAISASR